MEEVRLAIDIAFSQDIEQLRRIAQAQHAQIEQLIVALKLKCSELERLRGREGELQQTLALVEQLEAQAATAIKLAAAHAAALAPKRAPKPRSKTGPTPQPKLPTVELHTTLDVADQACTACGAPLAPLDGQTEDSDMIDVVDVQYRVMRVKRQKYVCRCGGCVETAPGPARATAHSRYSQAFALKVVVDKYLDHLPLARQVRILARHDVKVTSQTLWDLSYEVTTALAPVSDAILARVLAAPVIGVDQTSWPRLDADAAKPWQMWAVTAPGLVAHRICDDKSAATFVDLLRGFRGTVVADALSTHAAGARQLEGITLAGCWAHVLRRFRDASEAFPEASFALDQIRLLYDIDERAGPDLLKCGSLRAAEAPPVLAALHAWFLARAGDTHIALGKAAAYALGIWDNLTRFVDDPRIPLDNNATERAFRGPVVGRKNHLGAKSRRGTEVAAIAYTVLETAKLQAVDINAYLTAALAAHARGEVLLPHDFATASPA